MDHREPFMAEPEDESALDIFEVDEYGTIRPRGAAEVSLNRQIFTDINPRRLDTPDDLVEAIESAYPLQVRVEVMAEAELGDDVDDADDEVWCIWVRRLDAAGLAALRQKVLDWLDEEADWEWAEFFPQHAGPQGEGLAYFESLRIDDLEELGVVLVYGDHPGSSYFAAELKTDIESANSRAIDLGLCVRFVCEGEAYAPPPPSPLQDRRRALDRVFTPAFGLLPDIAEGLDDRPPAQAPLPPASLLPAHDPEGFELWWERALVFLRDPVRVWVDPQGVRHIRVVGATVYSIDVAGTVQAWCWEIPFIGKCVLVPTRDVSVAPNPFGWQWLERWRVGLRLEVQHRAARRGHDLPEDLVDRYIDWMLDRFRGRIRSGCDLRQLRLKVARAMELDPVALDAARRTHIVQPRSAVTAEGYNRVVEHRAAVLQLRQDAPRLVGLFLLVCDRQGFPAKGEPVQRLKRYLQGRGVSQRGWRLIQGASTRLLQPLAELRDDCASEVVAYLKMIDALGWRAEPDRGFMRCLLATLEIELVPNGSIVTPFDFTPRTMRRVVDWFETADDDGQAEILQYLGLVVRWLDAEGIDQCEGLARHPGWRDTLRWAQAWERKSEAIQRVTQDGKGLRSWPTPADVVVKDLEVRFIASAAELYEEGRVMRHCAFDYLQGCQEQAALIGSIRRRKTGRREATVMLAHDGERWAVRQVKKFANRLASQDAVDAAGVAAEALLGWGVPRASSADDEGWICE